MEANLNCWVLLLSILFLRVVTQCLNGNTIKVMRNQFFGSLCIQSFRNLMPDSWEPVSVMATNLPTLHFIANKLVLGNIR
jgi:hypothetical protein